MRQILFVVVCSATARQFVRADQSTQAPLEEREHRGACQRIQAARSALRSIDWEDNELQGTMTRFTDLTTSTSFHRLRHVALIHCASNQMAAAGGKGRSD